MRPTRSRTATSTSRASASAATASRSTPTSSSTPIRTCGCRRWLATSTRRWPAFAVDTIEDRIGSLDGPAGARARHRLPRRRARGCLQLRLPAARRASRGRARASTATTRTSQRRSPAASSASSRTSCGSGVPVRVAILQAAHAAYRSLDPADPARPRAPRRRAERARARCRSSGPGSGTSESAADVAAELPSVGLAAGRGVWVVLSRPTTSARTSSASRTRSSPALPEASLLIVDDISPDGTGELADTIAAQRAARLGAASAGQAGARRRVPRRVPLGPRAARRRGRSSRWTPTSATTRADLPRLLAPLMGECRPRARHALHAGRRHGRLAVVSAPDQPRRDALRANRPAPALPRPDRWVQGLAARAARVDPPARDLRLGLRLPGGDDVVGASSRRQHRPGADRLPGADRRERRR